MGTCSSSHPEAFTKTVEVPGLKIAVVGDAEVGKSSILARYIHNQFSPIYIPTGKVSIENIVKKLNVPGHATVPITFWDLPSKEDLPLHKSYFRNLDAVIVTVDLSDASSIESGKLWRQAVLDTASFTQNEIISATDEENENSKDVPSRDVNNIPFLLLGNKYDLIRRDDEEDSVIGDPKNQEIINVKHYDTGTKAVENCAQQMEEAASHGFVGSVMVSAKANDLSVHGAIQSFLRHILVNKHVDRRWRVCEKVPRVRRPRYEQKFAMAAVGIDEIDREFSKVEEIIYRVTSLHNYQRDSLGKFAAQCVEIGVIATVADASMQNCLVSLRDKLGTLDLKLKLKLEEDFYFLEVKASTEDAELEKPIRYTIKTFNKEYAAVTKAMLTEYPLAKTKLEEIDQNVERLCQQYEISPSAGQAPPATLTSADLLWKAKQVEKNRAVLRHTLHQSHDDLAHIQRSVKQAKAAFVW